jgi:hypothetical protein
MHFLFLVLFLWIVLRMLRRMAGGLGRAKRHLHDARHHLENAQGHLRNIEAALAALPPDFVHDGGGEPMVANDNRIAGSSRTLRLASRLGDDRRQAL